MKSSKLLKSLRVDDPDRFSLASFDPSGTTGLSKSDAEHRWAILVVLQGMDTAGKDVWSSM